MEAIVLDGDQRPALAITRSLGKRGIRVTVGAETKPSLASCSRFCADSFEYPSPYQDPEGFFQAVLLRTRGLRQAILLPVTDVTVSEILGRRGEFAEGIVIPFDGFEKYRLLSDKAWLVSQCRTLGLPMPRSVLSTDSMEREDAIVAAKEIGFPLVIKPNLSRIRTKTGWIGTRVRYARDEKELREILSSELFSRGPFILQERIQGPGVGIFLLMKDGVILARFAHRRLREKPPSGGVSVLCESIEPPAAALDAATRLLAGVRWNGVAMVEFKIDERGDIPRILEVQRQVLGFPGACRFRWRGFSVPALPDGERGAGRGIDRVQGRIEGSVGARGSRSPLDPSLSKPRRSVPSGRVPLPPERSGEFRGRLVSTLRPKRGPPASRRKTFPARVGTVSPVRRGVASGEQFVNGIDPVIGRALGGFKRTAKRLYWRTYGLFLTHPPVPPSPRSLLFVCKGNICRSPFAEAMAVAGTFPTGCGSAVVRRGSSSDSRRAVRGKPSLPPKGSGSTSPATGRGESIRDTSPRPIWFSRWRRGNSADFASSFRGTGRRCSFCRSSTDNPPKRSDIFVF